MAESNQNFINEISACGTTLTLRVVTDSSFSKWGDPTESTSDSSVTAVIQTLSQEDELVKDGIFQSGDKKFFFKPDQSNLDRGNRIVHNSLEYEISNVVPKEHSGTTFVIEVVAKKI